LQLICPDCQVVCLLSPIDPAAPCLPKQGMTLGSLPQFLGSWYGSSPSAAGHTFTADLGSSPASDNTAPGGAAPITSEVADETSDAKEPEHDQPAASGSKEEEEAVATPAEVLPTTGSTSPAAPASTPALFHTLLLLLLSASTLAAMLLLLSATAAGTSYNNSTTSPSSFTRPAFHTTSSDVFKPFSSSSNRLITHLQPPSNSRFPGAARKLYTSLPAEPTVATAPTAAPAAAAAAAAPAVGGSSKRAQLPWWLQYHASSAMRRAGKTAHGECRRLALDCLG
jgi:hypothetical protein